MSCCKLAKLVWPQLICCCATMFILAEVLALLSISCITITKQISDGKLLTGMSSWLWYNLSSFSLPYLLYKTQFYTRKPFCALFLSHMSWWWLALNCLPLRWEETPPYVIITVCKIGFCSLPLPPKTGSTGIWQAAPFPRKHSCSICLALNIQGGYTSCSPENHDRRRGCLAPLWSNPEPRAAQTALLCSHWSYALTF